MLLSLVLCSNLWAFTALAQISSYSSSNVSATNSAEMPLDHLWTMTPPKDWNALTNNDVDEDKDDEDDDETPVFVSDLIKVCDYGRARRRLRVKPILGVRSYSGFVTVNRRYNSNLFFWLVRSQTNATDDDPVVVWLMGYPGLSSMYAAFQENGPFRLADSDGAAAGNGSGVTLTLNEYSWTKRYNMLYIDSPVGVGYSFTDNVAGFSRNQQQMAANLHQFMDQFYQVFPQLRKNRLFVGGESYGGKSAATLAYEIHKSNPMSHFKMNLAGLFVGNAFMDPINMLEYSDYLYRLGIIDYRSFLDVKKMENNIKRLIRMEEWNKVVQLDQRIQQKIKEAGYDHAYDFTHERIHLLDNLVAKYLNEAATKRRFHVGDTPFSNHEMVHKYLLEDEFQSVKVEVEKLLSHLKILFYSGQFDMLVTRANTNKFTNKLKWADAIQFAKQQPITWRVEGQVAGYVASVSNLTEVLVRNAHHMTAASQPEYVFRLFNLFVDSGQFNDNTLVMATGDYV